VSEWETKSISDVAEVIGGGTPSSKRDDYYGGEIPWITPRDLSGYKNKFISRGERNISEAGLNSSSAKLLPKNSVLISSRAPIGYVAIAFNPVATNQGFKSLILKEGNDPHFFYYLIKSNVKKLESVSSGSTFKEISGSVLKAIEFKIPGLNTQKKISSILNPLDEKIELNQKMNATLEAMAQGLFKSWFVDFDPVKAKLAAVRCGRDPEKAAMAAIACKLVVPPGKPKHDNLEEKLPSAEAIDAAIASLETLSEEQMQSLKEKAAHFPSDFIDSELGLIPLGWEIEKIGNVLDTVLGGTPARKNKDYWENGNVPWINSGKVNEFRVINPTEFITNEALKKSATKLLPNRTTLLAITGATLGQISLNEIPCCANQSVVGVIGNKLISSEYVYQWMNNIIQKLISAQTGGAQQHINKGNVNEASILLPKEPSMIQYNHMVKVIFDLIALKCFENDNLSNLRDALLPKLLSGEISVASD
jgi:type I restriction enzyme S subunit